MLELKVGSLLSPMVKTSDFGGLPMEDLAELCAVRIITVADSAPPAIREQARLFQDQLRKVLVEYLNHAKQSERATCIQICLQGGHTDAATLLRRT
jgi:hypothetical protein